MMGYRTPNIDRIAKEGVSFTDYTGNKAVLQDVQRYWRQQPVAHRDDQGRSTGNALRMAKVRCDHGDRAEKSRLCDGAIW